MITCETGQPVITCETGQPALPLCFAVQPALATAPEKAFFIDHLLVRIHIISEIIWWTGLAPWEFEPPEALCGGISKVNFQETLSSFGDKFSQNGSKNGLRAPRTGMGCPHIGPSVVPFSGGRSALHSPSSLIIALKLDRAERIFVELMTSDRQLKASRGGSK